MKNFFDKIKVIVTGAWPIVLVVFGAMVLLVLLTPAPVLAWFGLRKRSA